MDVSIIKKKLSTYLSNKGQLRNLPEDLLLEVLVSWEKWTGKNKDFYKGIGISSKQMAGIIGKAKKLKREGVIPISQFQEVKLNNVTETSNIPKNVPIILKWEKNKFIKFYEVDHLVDFLKKVS